MTDSSFESAGGAIDNVNIVNPQADDMLRYDGTQWYNTPFFESKSIDKLSDVDTSNSPIRDRVLGWDGTNWSDNDPRTWAPAIAPIGTNRYYFPRAWYGFETHNGGEYSAMVAIKFAQNVTVDKWCFGYDNNGTIAAGNTGIKVRGYIYDSGTSTGRPHTLIKDLGYQLVKASDDTGGYSSEVRQVTLGSTVQLDAGKIYWVGLSTYPVNAGTHNYSASPQFITHNQQNLGFFWNNGTNPAAFAATGTFAMWLGAYYNSAASWSTFDFASGTLPNNIQNQVGVVRNAVRIGLSLSAI
jgi:hypothetical protein